MAKIIRTICYFTANPNNETIQKLNSAGNILSEEKYEIQTKRICSKSLSVKGLEQRVNDDSIILSIGSLNRKTVLNQLDDFLSIDRNLSFNLDLSKEFIAEKDGDFVNVNGSSGEIVLIIR